jgi:hypothetical protein
MLAVYAQSPADNYLALEHAGSANLAAWLIGRHIIRSATEDLKIEEFKPEFAGYGKQDVMKSAA